MARKGSVLIVGDHLGPDDYLSSANGKYVAYLQDDLNFVLYHSVSQQTPAPDWSRPYWASAWAGTGVTPAVQQSSGPPYAMVRKDGDFVLYRGTDPKNFTDADAYWSTGTVVDPPSCVLILGDDGNLVLSTGTGANDVGEVLWGALPDVAVQCKFMQCYRASSPVNGGAEIAAVRNHNGDVVLFTLGADHEIYAIRPGEGGDDGYHETALTSGLGGTVLAAGLDNQQRVVLFAANGSQLYAVTETAAGSDRWGAQQAVTGAGSTAPIKQVTAANVGGELFVTVAQKPDNGGSFLINAMQWGHDLSLRASPETFAGPTPPPVYLYGADAATATATFVASDKLVGIPVGNRALPTTNWQVSSPKLAGVDVDADGKVYAVIGDAGQVCTLATGPGGTHSWAPLWPDPLGDKDHPVKFQQVRVESKAGGTVHVFAVAQAAAVVEGDSKQYNVLYHWTADGDGTPPLPIHRGDGMSIGSVSNDDGQVDLFTVDAADVVSHLFLEEGGDNWVVEGVLDSAAADRPIIEYAAYATEITVYDSAHAVAGGTAVNVEVPYRTRLMINGRTYFADADRPAPVTANADGILSIVQETDTLSGPLLKVSLPGLAHPDAPQIVVEPYVDVQSRLAATSEDALREAQITDDDGVTTYLLDDTTRNDSTTIAGLHNALQTYLGPPAATPLMAATRTPGKVRTERVPGRRTPKPGPTPRRRGPRTGNAPERDRFWSRHAVAAGHLHTVAVTRHRRTPSRMTFDGHQIVFEHLTAKDAQRHHDELVASTASVTTLAAASWWRKIGDLLRSVAEGLAKVIEVIDTAVSTAIKVIINGLEYVFTTVVSLIEDAFDMVELVFAQVKVFFQKLYEWLAWLFDWKNIIRTKNAIVHVVNTTLTFLQDGAVPLKAKLDADFGQLSQQVTNLFGTVLQGVAGPYTIGAYDQRNTQPDVPYSQEAAGNNFLYSDMNSNGDNAQPATTQAAHALTAGAAGTDPMQVVTQRILTLAQSASTCPAMRNASDYLAQIGGSPDSIFRNALGALFSLVQGVAEAALNQLSGVVDSLLDVITTLVGALKQILNQQWNIPFVSAFYKWATKSDLTMLDLLALIVAIPTSFLCKLTGVAPFPDDASVTAFENAVTSDRMLVAAGLKQAPMPALKAAAQGSAPAFPLTDAQTKGLAAGFLIASIVSTVTGAFNDGQPLAPPANPYWGYASIVFTVISVGLHFPWFYSQAADDVVRPLGVAPVYWISVIGMIMYLFYRKFGTSVTSDMMCLLMMTLGAGLLAAAAYNSVGGEGGLKVAWQVVAAIPTAMKIMKLAWLVTRTTGTSLKILVGVDLVFGLTAAGLGFAVLFKGNTASAAANA